MNKLTILQKVLGVIHESLSASDDTTSQNGCQVDSSTVTLTDNPVEEQAIKELSREFARVLNDRNFESLDGRAEYHLYTMNHLIELVKNSDEQNTIELFNDNKIISKYEDCEFISIIFSADQEQAEVVYSVRTSIVSAKEKFFKELNKHNKGNKIEDGTPFSTTYMLTVEKERGTWKVSKLETTGKVSKHNNI